jgi:hypothetical protein
MKVEKVYRFGTPGHENRISGETAFIFMLHRLAYPAQLISFEERYGKTLDQLSRMFTCMINDMFKKWHFLLNDNLQFFSRKFSAYNQSIINKLRPEERTDPVINVAFTIDGTILEVCKPGQDRTGGHHHLQRVSVLYDL